MTTEPTAPTGASSALPTLAVISGVQVRTGPKGADGDRRQRQEQVLVRFSADEYADLTRLAVSSGQSKQTLLRAALHHLIAMEAR